MVRSSASALVMARSTRTRRVRLDSPSSSAAIVPLPDASATRAWKPASSATNCSSSVASRMRRIVARSASSPAASMWLAAWAVAAGSR